MVSIGGCEKRDLLRLSHGMRRSKQSLFFSELVQSEKPREKKQQQVLIGECKTGKPFSTQLEPLSNGKIKMKQTRCFRGP